MSALFPISTGPNLSHSSETWNADEIPPKAINSAFVVEATSTTTPISFCLIHCQKTALLKAIPASVSSQTVWEYCKEHFENQQILRKRTIGGNRIPKPEPAGDLRIHPLLWNVSSRFCFLKEWGTLDWCFSFSEGIDRVATLLQTKNGLSLSRARRTSRIQCERNCLPSLESSAEKKEASVENRLTWQYHGAINVFGEICISIYLFIPKLLFGKITTQRIPQNGKKKKLLHIFAKSEGTTSKRLA